MNSAVLPAPTVNPYADNLQRFSDVTELPRRTLSAQLAIIVALVVVVVALTVGIIVVAIQAAHPRVYAFGYDRVRTNNGHAVVTESVTPIELVEMQQKSAVLREVNSGYYLPLFVESLFTVGDYDADKTALVRFVKPFIAPSSQAESMITDYLSRYNPVTRSAKYHVVVQADPLPPARPTDGMYHVTWTARTFSADHRLLSTERGGALVALRWDTPHPTFTQTSDGSTIGGNPVGMYVSQLIPDRTLDPQAAQP
jgi:hypothetical protein